MKTIALGVLVTTALAGCNLLKPKKSQDDASASTAIAADTATTTTAPGATTTIGATTTTGAPSGAAATGDEAGARALLMAFLSQSADHEALTKPLRPTAADYGALFDAPTAAKLGPQYDAHWDRDPMVISPKPGQTELEIWGATTEELRAGTGNSGEFPGGWKRVAPHLAPGHTWYRFKFVKPGKHLGMSFDGLTFVNGHWVLTPKPWRGI